MVSKKETPKYHDKIYLKHQFLELEISVKEIAKDNGVSTSTIRTWLKNFDIKKEKLHHDKKWLRKQYLDLKKSILEISIMCRANESTISNWLKKFEIPMRTRSEAMKLVMNRPEVRKKMSETKKLNHQNKLKIRKELNENNNEIRNKYRQYKNNKLLVERNEEIFGII